MKEKESRDEQIRQNYMRKRIELLKEKLNQFFYFLICHIYTSEKINSIKNVIK